MTPFEFFVIAFVVLAIAIVGLAYISKPTHYAAPLDDDTIPFADDDMKAWRASLATMESAPQPETAPDA